MSITLDKQINFWTASLSIILDVKEFDAIEFARWLKEKRENFHPSLSVTDLAKKAGISKQYISLLEKGDDHLLTNKPVQPALDKVERIAQALGININEARTKAGYDAIKGNDLSEIDEEFAVLFFDSANWSPEVRREAIESAKMIFKGFQEKERSRKN